MNNDELTQSAFSPPKIAFFCWKFSLSYSSVLKEWNSQAMANASHAVGTGLGIFSLYEI